MIKLTTSGFLSFGMASLMLVFLFLGALFLPNTALACSCAQISAEEHVAGSKYVFKGTIVERRQTEPSDAIFGNGAVFDFQIEKSWKGTDAKRISVSVPTTESSLCGIKLPIGWNGVVFADEEKGKSVTSLCAMLPYHRGQLEDYDKLLPGHR